MRKPIQRVCALCLLGILTLFSCTAKSGPVGTQVAPAVEKQGTGSLISLASADGNGTMPASVRTFGSMEQLRAWVPTSPDTVVYLAGYYEIGDGGGGSFLWNEKSTDKDNGGTVIAPNAAETGRFIRMCDENVRNVRWFGAVGTGKKDDWKAIQNAIDSLPLNGGTVIFPGGTYAITKTIQIGDGDGNTHFSSRNGIRLVGEGAGFSVYGEAVPTTILAAASMPYAVRVDGRFSDFNMEDLAINCNSRANIGLSMTAVSGTTLTDVKIQQFRAIGMEILGGEEPVGNYNIYNRFETVHVISSMDNTTCLLMDGVYTAHNDTWLTTFIDCSFDTASCANAIGAHFRFVDSNSFYRCTFGGSGENSVGMLFDAEGNNDFPCGMAFYDCSVSSTEVIETETDRIRTSYFYGFATSNNEVIPTHNRLIGITDQGVPFNMDSLTVSGGGGSGGGTSGLPIKRGIFDLYTPGAYSHVNLALDHHTVGVHFAAGGAVKGGTFYLPNYSDSNGTVHLDIYAWNTDYPTSVSGSAVYSCDFVDFDDNTWVTFDIADGLAAGEYVLVLSAEMLPGDEHGCGVWTKASTGSVETFMDGYLADFGLVGQLKIQ